MHAYLLESWKADPEDIALAASVIKKLDKTNLFEKLGLQDFYTNPEIAKQIACSFTSYRFLREFDAAGDTFVSPIEREKALRTFQGIQKNIDQFSKPLVNFFNRMDEDENFKHENPLLVVSKNIELIIEILSPIDEESGRTTDELFRGWDERAERGTLPPPMRKRGPGENTRILGLIDALYASSLPHGGGEDYIPITMPPNSDGMCFLTGRKSSVFSNLKLELVYYFANSFLPEISRSVVNRAFVQISARENRENL